MNSYAKFGATYRYFTAICEKPIGCTYVPPCRARVNHEFDNILPEFEPSGSIILVPRAQNVKTPDFDL